MLTAEVGGLMVTAEAKRRTGTQMKTKENDILKPVKRNFWFNISSKTGWETGRRPSVGTANLLKEF
jgi:hypothetical protein